MTEEDFVAAMRCLFQVWHGTDNADLILTDVVDTIGHQCFERTPSELRELARRCKLSPRPQSNVTALR